MSNDNFVLIRGGGDLATGVALRLRRAGIRVVITELAQPLAVRRAVSFSEAVYEGMHTVEGVRARRIEGSNSRLGKRRMKFQTTRAGLAEILGRTEENNIQGEIVQKLDQLADLIMFRLNDHTGRLRLLWLLRNTRDL